MLQSGKSNHSVITSIDRDLRASGLSEQWPGHGCNHVADVLGFDLDLHEVLGFVFLHCHAITLSAALKCLRRLQLRVEHRVGMDDVAAHLVLR